MTDERYSLDRRQLLQTTAAGVAGAVALTGTATASGRRAQQEAPDEDEYETILDEMDGDGSESNPYVVTDVVELQAMNGDLKSFYELANDIDGSATAEWNDGAGFTPLGLRETKFNSVLDGKGNEIRNVVVNRPDSEVVGLFGWMRGQIANLTLSNVEVTGGRSVGVACGTNQGIVNNVTARGTASGADFVGGLAGANASRMVGSRAESTVTGEKQVGGLCGSNVGSVLRSESDSEVSGTSFVGGIAGKNSSTMRNVTATGTVEGEVKVGGVFGESANTAEAVTSEATVSGREKVGGIVGENAGPIRGAKSLGEVSGSRIVGGIVGKNWDSLVGAVAEGSVSADSIVGGIAGWNSSNGAVTSTVVLGAVDSGESAGSLVGRLGREFQNQGESAHLRNGYWNADATSNDAVGADMPADGETTIEDVAGLSPAQMQGQNAVSNMPGLNFERVWRVIPDDFPRLRAFTPADIAIAELSSQQLAVREDQTAALSVTLENSGEWSGVRDVVFSVRGEDILKQTVTLAPGSSQTVEFQLNGNRLPVGEHPFTVTAGRQAREGVLIIQSAPELGGDDGGDETETPDDSDDGGSSSDGNGPGFGVGGAIAGLGGAYLAARRLLGDEE